MCNVYLKLDPILNQAQRFLNLKKKSVKTELQDFKWEELGSTHTSRNLQFIKIK